MYVFVVQHVFVYPIVIVIATTICQHCNYYSQFQWNFNKLLTQRNFIFYFLNFSEVVLRCYLCKCEEVKIKMLFMLLPIHYAQHHNISIYLLAINRQYKQYRYCMLALIAHFHACHFCLRYVKTQILIRLDVNSFPFRRFNRPRVILSRHDLHSHFFQPLQIVRLRRYFLFGSQVHIPSTQSHIPIANCKYYNLQPTTRLFSTIIIVK